jgi:tetratricopeptide (TPR) repeat protein
MKPSKTASSTLSGDMTANKALGGKNIAMWRSISQVAQYVIEAVLLTVFGVWRIARASFTGGDVYDAKVIYAGDIADLGGHRLAVRWLSNLIESNPSRPRAYLERAMAYLALKDKASAIKDFERCLQIDPAFPGAREWYARASK